MKTLLLSIFTLLFVPAFSQSISYCNLQYPETITLNQFEEEDVYGQVYIGTITDINNLVTSEIDAWIGVSDTNTDPSTWDESAWTAAVPTPMYDFSLNNDEFTAKIGAELSPGTYYYATRFRYNAGENNGVFYYGGFSGSGGGFWGGANVSGVLTINAPQDCGSAATLEFDGVTNETQRPIVPASERTASGVTDCGSNTPDDVWYQFTMPFDGNIDIILAGVNFTIVQFYSGDCSNLVSEYCGGNGGVYGLTGGETYYVQAWANSVNKAVDFRLKAYEPLTNQDCTTAEELNFDTNDETQTINEEFGVRTPSGQTNCNGNTTADIWYKFTMPFDGNIDAEIAGTNFTSLQIFSGDCNNLTQVYCGANGYAHGLIEGQEYYVQAFATVIDRAVNFSLTAHELTTNDECVQAEPITFEADNSADVFVDYDGASTSADLASCQNGNFNDAWFSMTSPITGTYAITDGPTFNTRFAIYKADGDTCYGEELYCIAGNGATFNVTQGNEYIIRAFRDSREGSYTMTLTPTATPASTASSGSCVADPIIPVITIDGTNNSEWVSILDNSGNVVAAINANGNNLGTVSTSLFIDNVNDYGSLTGEPEDPIIYYMRRYLTIDVQNEPTTPLYVRFYFKKEEFNDLNIVDNTMDNISDLTILKLDDESCSTDYEGKSGEVVPMATTSYTTFDYSSEIEISSFSKFIFLSGVNANILPVKLVDFTVQKTDDSAQLEWVTASEQDNEGFHIQHSLDGINFTNIGWVEGAGDSSQEQHYSFTHQNPSEGVNYYRLHQVDFDGSSEYSEIKSIDFDFQNSLVVYPNPANDFIKVDSDEQTSVRIINRMGQVVKQIDYYEGDEIAVADLPSGLYILETISGEKTQSQIFIKQ